MRRAGALLVLVALLAGCGGSGHKAARRDAVNTYIQQVDAVAAALVGERARIDSALRAFSMTKSRPGDISRLRGVQTQIHGVSLKVRGLHPPPEARKLHADLVQLLDLAA